MLTIQQATEQIVRKTPFWVEAMEDKLINNSSLARKIQPEVERILMKPVKTGAIIIALNRMTTGMSVRLKKDIEYFIGNLGDITVKSDICDMTFKHSSTLSAGIAQVINEVSSRKKFFTVSDGVAEVTIVASQSLKPVILEVMKDETMINEKEGLASLTLNLPKNNAEQSGIYYFILRQFAWANVNIVEVISTTNEITLVVQQEDVNLAFSKLMEMKN